MRLVREIEDFRFECLDPVVVVQTELSDAPQEDILTSHAKHLSAKRTSKTFKKVRFQGLPRLDGVDDAALHIFRKFHVICCLQTGTEAVDPGTPKEIFVIFQCVERAAVRLP